MTGSHRHMHRRRGLMDDIGNIIDGFKDPRNDGHNGHDDDQGSDGGHSGQQTVIQIVYKTLSKTFDGPVAGYSTVHDAPPPSPTKIPEPQAKPTSAKESEAQPKETQSHKEPSRSSAIATSMPTAISSPHQTETVDSSVLVKATGSASYTSTFDGNRQFSTSAIPSSTAAAALTGDKTTSGSGTSAGAKAGIAFGVIGGVFVVGLLVFLLFNRRRQQAQRQQLNDDDEKFQRTLGGSNDPIASMASRTNPNAPRISLRPVTQFFPNLNLEKRTSKGAALALATAAPMGIAVTGESSDRPNTSQSNHSANPFGNQAERVPSPIHEEEDGMSSQGSPPRDITNNEAWVNAQSTSPTGGAAAGAVGLTRKASMRNQNTNQIDLTVTPPLDAVPPSPAGTEFSVSSAVPGPAAVSESAAAIAAAGGPANSTVHRVQLDFKPTLDDEMGLNAGDLVRLLHEYDDGWALVIRLDRSQQGVVPRTCLSTRPVKPRPVQGRPPVNPSGPPRGPHGAPGQRPMTPQGMQANGLRMGPGAGPRPASPAGGRPMNPGRQSPMGRPMSPGPRPQGPPNGRPQSPAGMNQRPSPPRSSPLNPSNSPPPGPPTGPIGRKPVPGQAY